MSRHIYKGADIMLQVGLVTVGENVLPSWELHH